MTAIQEVAVTSCLNDTVVSAYMWDVQTGTNMMTYRGDASVTTSGLSMLSAQYLVAALQDKPFLRVWPVNSQQALSAVRLLCPGKVTHAQASPDSCYIAVTVAEKLHIYQLASGYHVGTGMRHFQPIRVVRWTADGSQVVCGGEDGLVTVWSLAALTSQSHPEARHALSDHTLPVTDLTITSGSRPRLLSVSLDRTCKIYDLSQGSLLVSLVFDKILTAVTTSTLETDVFVGTGSGTILQMSLLSPPRHLEYHFTTEEDVPMFTGHSKAVWSLCASLNGELLMSSSTDGYVKIWHISSRQCLRTLAHKGPVTNAFFAVKPKQVFDNELKPSVVINAFQMANSDRRDKEADCIDVINEQSLNLCDNTAQDLHRLFPKQVTNCSDDRVKSLQTEIDLLRSINSNLYKFTVDKIITDSTVLPCVPPEHVTDRVNKRKRKRGNRGGKRGKKIEELVNRNKHNKKRQEQEDRNVVQINGLAKKRKKRGKKIEELVNRNKHNKKSQEQEDRNVVQINGLAKKRKKRGKKIEELVNRNKHNKKRQEQENRNVVQVNGLANKRKRNKKKTNKQIKLK